MGNKPVAKRYNYVSLKMVRESTCMFRPRQIKSPEDATSIFQQFLEGADREHFMGLYLNTKNEPVAIHTISIGTLNSSLVHPRECFKAALLSNAASVIFCHNHPSNIVNPSPEDLEIAQRLSDAGEILGIDVMDFCIIGVSDAFLSFKKKGYL